MLRDTDIKPCLGKENHPESVLLDGGCWARRLREREEGRDKMWEINTREERRWREKVQRGVPLNAGAGNRSADVCMNWAAGEKREQGGSEREI